MKAEQPRFKTLTEFVRFLTRGLTMGLGRLIGRTGVHPNVITIIGLIPSLISAALAANGQFLIAGLVLLFGAPMDALDGAVARATNRVSKFGALLDSTLDRYADGILFFGLAYYFATHGQMLEMVLAMATVIGAYGVSYVRARSEGSGIGSIQAGLFDRMVRMVILIIALLTSQVVIGIVILVVGTHATAIHRLIAAYQATKTK